MLKKLYQLVLGGEMEMRERMLRVIVLIGGVASVLGMLEQLTQTKLVVLAIPLIVMTIAIGTAIVTTFKYRKVEFSATLVGAAITFVVFPAMFFLSGGVDGGATIWFVQGLVYIFMMFSGRKLAFFLVAATGIDAATYWLAYRYPEFVVPMASQQAAYLDSFFGVAVVGFSVGAILKFQMRSFEIERTAGREQREQLSKISNSKNEFFARLSHEIRTPINTIVGLNEMILRESQEGGIREYARDIRTAGTMLLNLVNDIMDLSQMEINRMEIIPVEYRTEQLFRDLADMARIGMQEKKLEFLIDIDEKMPSVLYGDDRRIKQIFLNLLTNAVKYTKEGSVTLSAYGELTENGQFCLMVSVSDTGIGIRKEDVEYLYDAFRRVDVEVNQDVEGSGLGLAITKQLIEMMGGEITVDSIYTKGTSFMVTINQKVIDASPIGKPDFLKKSEEEDRAVYRQSFEAPEARILIVDDNTANAMVAEKLLASTKVQVDIVHSGAACLERTKQKYYHVILMDYMMPRMDGVETLKELRRQENSLCRESAVIVLTANLLNGPRRLCQEYGFDGYLEKPIRVEELESEILRFLPEDIIEYRLHPVTEVEGKAEIRQLAGRRRKRVYITTECVSDLPEELLEKYDIRLMYLYITTESGRFADTREIDADSLSLYLADTERVARADSVSVEEYEEFFAEALTQAEHVVHISMAAHAGKSYSVAVLAAKGFDHVHVIDSGSISGGEGLVVLYAAKMAMEGYTVAEICRNLERVKKRVETAFLMPSARIFYRNGYTSALTAKLCDILQLHPILELRQSRLVIVRAKSGKLENAWKRFIRGHLRWKRKINTDVVFITYVGVSVKQLEMIRQEILKQVPFEKVIMQKASFSNACNAGIGTVGIAYYTEG